VLFVAFGFALGCLRLATVLQTGVMFARLLQLMGIDSILLFFAVTGYELGRSDLYIQPVEQAYIAQQVDT
jgi:hypothetical protein